MSGRMNASFVKNVLLKKQTSKPTGKCMEVSFHFSARIVAKDFHVNNNGKHMKVSARRSNLNVSCATRNSIIKRAIY